MTVHSDSPLTLDGGCHCGNISFTLTWRGDAGTIPARACSCSFCTKHGAVWTAHHGSELTVTVKSAERVTEYQQGTLTATFHLCNVCGVVPLVTSEIEARTYAVVNVNTFRDVDESRLDRAPVSFDGEETADRLARRARGWIGTVTFSAK